MKGYKAFNKGLICDGKQYAENTVFAGDRMRFCVDALEVLDYYLMLNEKGEEHEFAEVEALDKPVTNDGKTYVSKKLKIIKKISIDELFATAAKQITKSEKFSYSNNDKAIIVSSSDKTKIASLGSHTKIASLGDFEQIKSSGDYARIASLGFFGQIISSGNFAQISSSGTGAQINSSGDDVRISSSGGSAQIVSSGKNAIICCTGLYCAVKGKKGSWITLTDYEKVNEEYYIPVYSKTKEIDGVEIKEDTFYTLQNGKFIEKNYGG